MDLMRASNEWATRPADERFWTLEELIAAADGYKSGAVEKTARPCDMEIVAIEDKGLGIRNRAAADDIQRKAVGTFSHFSFGQTCGLLKAPAGFMRELSNKNAASVLNERLAARGDDMMMLWDKRKGMLRAMNSERYGRIWNADIARKVAPLQEQGWRNPPARPAFNGDPRQRPATQADILASATRPGGGLGIRVGDPIAPAGLYLSEKDMFLFLVNETRGINGGKGVELYRGFFLENSEVGDRSFRLTTFLYNMVCGNHIVWGAQNVEELRVVHLGNANTRAFDGLRCELRKYCESSANDIEARIASAKAFILGKTKDEVVKALLFDYKLKGTSGITETLLTKSYEECEKHPEDGGGAPPTSAWGMVQGMTRLSQTSDYADERVNIDRVASKILTATVPF